MHIRARKALDNFLDEDIGKGDITSNLLPRKKITASIISRQEGVVAGVQYVKYFFVSRGCKVKILKKDGSKIKPNQKIIIISGFAHTILSCERTALNLLSRMSGIATQTNHLVNKIKKTNPKVKLYSTRKTAPGLRLFDKDAVEIGGGNRHRMSLDQMIMIKDNHLAVSDSVWELVQKARKKYKIVEVEVEGLNDAILAAKAGASIIMLDNRSPNEISKIINILKKLHLRDKIRIEASGGIDSTNIQSYAKTGVDMISVGKITSSAPGLDLSLEVN
ncbi:MAG TPA: carboxylating nicotinate-nucleotide diphosphorylase [Nitrosopumilaceae archaeon]|nr:carboxylating nicotinate-nucleotide diphosphorylase [Nitrosopumilaceae archaeon]